MKCMADGPEGGVRFGEGLRTSSRRGSSCRLRPSSQDRHTTTPRSTSTLMRVIARKELHNSIASSACQVAYVIRIFRKGIRLLFVGTGQDKCLDVRIWFDVVFFFPLQRVSEIMEFLRTEIQNLRPHELASIAIFQSTLFLLFLFQWIDKWQMSRFYQSNHFQKDYPI